MSLKELLEKGRKAQEERKAAEADGPPTASGTNPVLAGMSDPALTDYGVTGEGEIERVEAMVESLPENNQMLEYLAFLYYSARRYTDAITLYKTLLDRDHRRAEQLFHLGNCYAREGDPIRARSFWRQCISNNPPPSVRKRVEERLGGDPTP